MLVMSRQKDEQIVIGKKGEIVITIVDIRGDKVRLGVEAPTSVSVHRREVFEAIQRENIRVSGLETTAQQSMPVQQIQVQSEPVQKDDYKQFIRYLGDGNFREAGRLYFVAEKKFEASHDELEKLSRGLYGLVQRR